MLVISFGGNVRRSHAALIRNDTPQLNYSRPRRLLPPRPPAAHPRPVSDDRHGDYYADT